MALARTLELPSVQLRRINLRSSSGCPAPQEHKNASRTHPIHCPVYAGTYEPPLDTPAISVPSS